MLTGFLGSIFGKTAMIWVAGCITYWIGAELKYKKELAIWDKEVSDYIKLHGLEKCEKQIRRLLGDK